MMKWRESESENVRRCFSSRFPCSSHKEYKIWNRIPNENEYMYIYTCACRARINVCVCVVHRVVHFMCVTKSWFESPAIESRRWENVTSAISHIRFHMLQLKPVIPQKKQNKIDFPEGKFRSRQLLTMSLRISVLFYPNRSVQLEIDDDDANPLHIRKQDR